ncbi:hypothetical protein DTW90_34495 [Neorhizobium sp. P12A]|uniref:hypothetical protein n=1 Tax=Neorhizobium sp. P12A TaxID=2268027 RepID=UPI0011EC406E|nr:hypothetical protein [Neorhizobium sp. P12A]KAA0685998.1 hypothetical protein DTW90_34495 [Neorhizobium sp. P12A]
MASLILGNITFQGFEIPEAINFGGRQETKVHKLLGGQRVVDTMGPDPDPVRWSGQFRGPDAMERAQSLDALRASGAQIPLYYLSTFVTVVISEFQANPNRPYEIPYRITCTVVDDNVNGPLGVIVNGIDAIVSSALSVAASFSAGGTDDAALQTASAVASVSTAVGNVGSLADAPATALQGISTAVYASSTTLGNLSTSLDATLGVGVGTDAGVDPDQMAAFVTGQVQNCADEVMTLSSKDYIDLVGKNVALAAG